MCQAATPATALAQILSPLSKTWLEKPEVGRKLVSFLRVFGGFLRFFQFVLS